MSEVVYHGDAFELLGELVEDSAHAAVIDYPWEFSAQNGTGRFEYRRNAGRTRGEGVRDLSTDDAMFDMESDGRIAELLDGLSRVLVDGAWAFFMADDRFQDTVRAAIRESSFTLRRNWAWTPEKMGMGYYGRVNHYPIPVATNGETERYIQDRGTLFSVPNGRDVEYPTGKPVGLYRALLAAPAIEDGERLLEPFCGSGPGAAVAAERGLGYWGCDVDVDAVELARKRLAQTSVEDWFTEGVA